ncbi:MAG: acetoacetate decarboxylase family protein [Gemmatimonadota bacterium]|nr:acetoacetate decarboxylase family protein [Gemmatimonadota bacterium]MDH5760555.1 acetoacetate decarboxylase family protein [Gemmatimonadota bacterium]
MDYTYYGFSSCVGAFFEMPTTDARKILPDHLQPVEMQHTRSILALTAFEFTESEVGAYNEIVMAVIVPPVVEPGKPLPKAAFYPFYVGTDTPESRAHAIERWHLPHYMKDLEIAFTHRDDEIEVNLRDDGQPVLDLVVTKHVAVPQKNLYNSFMSDDSGNYKANIYMEAPHSEHEEEGGSLTLYPHAMTESLTLDEIGTYPFREQWYQAGLQTFEPLETL